MHAQPGRARSAGFTLVELLVVAAILGVIAIFASHALVGLAQIATARHGPTEDPATSQAAFLIQLAGVAILMFGAGFWYLAELQRPGQLERFRLGHFLLLALNYSMFFVAFAVLDGRGWTMAATVPAAALVSYPLVTLHVAAITGWRFALTAALPLVAFTTGFAVVGVYGGDLRSLIYLVMFAGVVAFLTWSYPRLMRGVESHRGVLEQRLATELVQIVDEVEALRHGIVRARTLLAVSDRDDGSGLRRWLEQRVEQGHRSLETAEGLMRTAERVRTLTSRNERHQTCTSALTTAARLQRQLPQAVESLAATADNLAQHRARTAPAESPRENERHCIGCGHANPVDAHYCTNCGRPSTVRRECRRCASVLHLPPHLLRELPDGEAAATHCHCCGERHAEAS